MMTVNYDAKKCKRSGSFLKKKGSGVYNVPNNQYAFHTFCGCMTILEIYRMVTTDKGICPTCKQKYAIREKIVLQKIEGDAIGGNG